MSQPLPVSPLIRGARWGLFFLGIMYARGKQAIYNVMEASFQEKERIRKHHHAQLMAKLKEKSDAEERQVLKEIEAGTYAGFK